MNIFKKLGLFHYNIGFFHFDANVLTGNISINWMKHSYKDRFFADPFILDVNDDEIKVLAEEFIYKEWKGRISLLTIDRHSYCLKSIQSLLDLNSHLSFPFIFRENGETYIIPENSESGSLYAYHYTDNHLHKCHVLINQPVIDPVIIKQNETYFLFGSLRGRNENSDLFIWKSNDLFGKYESAHNGPVISNSPHCARRGGDFFHVDNITYSAVQNCTNSYGESLNLCQVCTLSETELEENIVTTICPDHRYKDGLHTFNKYKDLCVVDGLTYMFRPLHKLIYILKNNIM